MNKKGFTLIELLAVILILGIIALIAIPTVNNIINEARDSANMRNAEGYYKAIQNKLSVSMLKGNKISSGVYSTSDFTDLEFKGTKPDEGIILIQNDEVVGLELSYKNTKVTINEEGESSVVKNKVYGLKWDGNDNYTRLNDADKLTSCVGTNTVSCISDFDKEEIYGEIHDVTVDGNAFVYIPKFYIKKVVNQSDGKNDWEWYISKEKKDDNYYLPECFRDTATNKELSYMLIGKYDASLSEDGTKLESKSGVIPLVDKNINEFRTYATNNNVDGKVGYQLFDIHAVDAIQVLFYIEFGTLNSQNIMRGYSNGQSPWDDSHKVVAVNGNDITITSGIADSYKVDQLIDFATAKTGRDVVTNLKIIAINGDTLTVEDTLWTDHKAKITTGNIIYNVANINGQTNNIKASSGSIVGNTNSKYSMNYRGIENIYGGLWQFIDGINIDNDTSSIYVNKNAKTYASDKIDGDYKKVCYGNCDTAMPISKFNTEGWVTKMGYDISNPFINFPIAVGEFSDSKYGDYYYMYITSGKKIVLFGGAWTNGVNVGISSFDLYPFSSFSGLITGSRLLKTAL